MKKWLVFVAVVFALGIGGFIYFKQRLNKQNTNSKLVFNAATQKWEKYSYKDPVESDRESNTEE